jgi:hypothetical protein
MHLPLMTVIFQSIFQRTHSQKSANSLIANGLNKTEPNGTTFALISLKASRVKAMGRSRFR